MYDPCKRQRRSTRTLILMLVICFLAAVIISAQPGAILAQAATSTRTPTITYTASPYTPTITPTPSSTPTTIPTLAALLSNREVITAANANRLGKLRELQAHFQMITGIAFIPTTTHFITTGWENTDERPQPLRIWDMRNNQIVEVENYFEDSQRLLNGVSGELSVSPDGTRLVLSGYGVEVWDTQTGRLMGRVLQSGSAHSVIDSSNQTLLVGGMWRMIGIWLIPAVIPSEGPDAPPLPADYVYDPQGFLAGIFQIGEDVDQLAISSSTGHMFVLTDSGRLLIYKRVNEIDYDLTVVPQAPLQDAQSVWGKIWGIKGGHKMVLNEARHELTYIDRNRDVIVYDYVNNEVVDQYPRDDPTACLNYSPDGRLLLLTDWGWDMSLQLIDTTTHETLASIITGQVINSCTLSWDGKLIATGDTEGKIVLWGVPSEN